MHANDDPRVYGLLTALYTVARNAHRLRQVGVDSACDKAGYSILFTLRDTGPLRLSELAAAMHLDISTISRQVHALIAGGFCVASDDPADRRARRLTLTDRGHAELKEIVRQLGTALAETVQSWPDADVDTLTTLLRRLAADLETTLLARHSGRPRVRRLDEPALHAAEPVDRASTHDVPEHSHVLDLKETMQ